jgi:pimeloyl-ACP methyl ester carboxylesterase
LENLNVWDAVAGLLQSVVRVVAPDLPGHGISEVKGAVHSMEFLADTVYEALIEVGVVKCTVVGHSMGGYVALALAERHPEMLDGLVLFSSTPNADSPEKRLNREREIALVEGGKKELLARTLPGKGFAAENRRRLADEIEDFAELVMLTEDEGITALLRGMAERRDRNEVLQRLSGTERSRGAGGPDEIEDEGVMAERIEVPVLFVFGRGDEYISAEVAEAMAVAHPRARVVWLEHSGHNGMVEEPRAAAEAILKFVGVNDHKVSEI